MCKISGRIISVINITSRVQEFTCSTSTVDGSCSDSRLLPGYPLSFPLMLQVVCTLGFTVSSPVQQLQTITID